jgi:hypothetical protein
VLPGVRQKEYVFRGRKRIPAEAELPPAFAAAKRAKPLHKVLKDL